MCLSETTYKIRTHGYIQVRSSYNPLPRAAGKIQYESEVKLRLSNYILPVD